LRSLGRDSTIGDVEACLALLRELDIYATFNILLFDPYTRLEDIEQNIRFLRRNGYFPFNWCKVEPYAGTELEKRYGREGRLTGDYLGHDYRMDDERVRLLYDLLLPAVYYRNFDYYGLANLNIGLGYHRRLLKQFYPEQASKKLDMQVQHVIEQINTSALDLIETALEFVSNVNLLDAAGIERFGLDLRRRSFADQRRLSSKVEQAMREIEQAAGVRIRQGVGVSEAFTPLFPKPMNAQVASSRDSDSRAGQAWWLRALFAIRLAISPRAAIGSEDIDENVPSNPLRRRTMQAAGGAMIWLLAGCRHGGEANNPARPAVKPGGQPEGSITVAPGHAETVAQWESFRLEALLQPDDAVVVGEPRITVSGGSFDEVDKTSGGRQVRFNYHPDGGSTRRDPNVTITVAWTVHGKVSDSTVMARAFVHVQEDGGYVFGYQTPRPTIAEMAAPPIGRGPAPPPGG
jgi:hypothetical protein